MRLPARVPPPDRVPTAGHANGPTVCCYAVPLPARNYAFHQTGIHLVVPPTRAIPAACLPPQLKTRSRLHWHIADCQARALAANAQALLLDIEGFVTETATGNLFIVRKGALLTPSCTRTLSGISQQYVRNLAAECGWNVSEADLREQDLLQAEELFVTSSVSCMLPVSAAKPEGRGQRATGAGV